MADKKISQLTGATTPLAGTEVLPVVQSGVTKKVSVADLTAGRATSVGSLAVNTAAPLALVSIGDGTFTDASVPVQMNSASGGEKYYGFNKGGSYGMLMGYVNNISGVTAFMLRNIANDPIMLKINDVTHTTFATNGNILLGNAGAGIDFSADPSAAGMTSELLDDYEEGTWTPTDGSGAGLTFTVTNAVYTKIGRQVICTLQMSYPATASGANANISGLPFVSTNPIMGNIAATTAVIVMRGIYGSSGASNFNFDKNNATAVATNADLSGALIYLTILYTA